MRIALLEPDIPQNAAAILRLGACLGVPVDLIEPLGFRLGNAAMRRVGMDYLDRAETAVHRSFAAFDAWRRAERRRLVLATRHGSTAHVRFAFAADDVLLFGRESAGAPEAVHAVADARIAVPLRPGIRSLNLATAAAIVVAEALRQHDRFSAEAA
jgi:tRNA (cytidine/uridine-2'-O-)-methyltransferase